MKIAFLATLFAPILLLGASPSSAQDTADTANAQCPDIYAAVVCVYLAAAGEDRQLTGEVEAMEFLRLFNARGGWNDRKRDMVRLLERHGSSGANMTGTYPGGGNFDLAPPDAKATHVLKDVGETPRFDLAFAADHPGNDEELKRMATWLSHDLPAQQAYLLDWCVVRVHAVSMQSSMQNLYQPYKDFIEANFARLKVLEEDARPPVRDFLYRCSSKHDASLNDRIPDFLYSFLEVKAE